MFWNLYGRKNDFIFREKICLLQGWNPHIILEFSKRHDESIYFDSDEEMEGWFESFMEEFGKPFIYID